MTHFWGVSVWQKIFSNFQSSCLHCASIVSKTLFIIPTDAHYYKSVEMLKQFKVITLAPTCFGSRRNHHQGAVLCLAKTTDMVFFRACRYGLSQCNGGISTCCEGVRFLHLVKYYLSCCHYLYITFIFSQQLAVSIPNYVSKMRRKWIKVLVGKPAVKNASRPERMRG
jgi:hypothetical protein